MSETTIAGVGIDEAWSEAVAALPAGYGIEGLIRVDVGTGDYTEPPQWAWEAEASVDPPRFSICGYGQTPAEALLALAEKLRVPSRRNEG